jgi:hypothetical protein
MMPVPLPPSCTTAASVTPTVVVLPNEAIRVVPRARRRRVSCSEPVTLARFAPTEYPGKELPAEAEAPAPADCCKYRTLPQIWVVSSTLEDQGLTSTTEADRDFNVLWVAKARLEIPTALPNTAPKLSLEKVLAGLRPHQRVNHFPGSTVSATPARNTSAQGICSRYRPRTPQILTVKDTLVQGLRMHRRDAVKQGLDASALDFLPITYTLPAELPQLLKAQASNPERVWILKPAGGSGGREIALTSAPEEMTAYCTGRTSPRSSDRRSTTPPPADPDPLTYIASHYIENPLLVDGRKTDLRVYVLVTSFQPLRAYIYRYVAYYMPLQWLPVMPAAIYAPLPIGHLRAAVLLCCCAAVLLCWRFVRLFGTVERDFVDLLYVHTAAILQGSVTSRFTSPTTH